MLDITATQNDLSFQEETEVAKEFVEEHRELRQRVKQINYNEVAKGKAQVQKKEKPVPKKRARKNKQVQKLPLVTTSDERIVETINEEGKIERKTVKIELNSIKPLEINTSSANIQQFVSSLPSLMTPKTEYSNGITVLSSIPVQCVQSSNQQSIDLNSSTIILPCRSTPSGNNMIVDVSPSTFKYISDMTVEVPAPITTLETLETIPQLPLNQEITEIQTDKATPDNPAHAIDKKKVSKCMSTPSRKLSHVRTLSFKTPVKLRTILDESHNESDVTVIDKRMPSSCPPDIKGLCDDQEGMKSDVEEKPSDETSNGKRFF